MPNIAAILEGPALRLNILNRAMAQPWAMRKESLALITQLILAGDSPKTRSVMTETGPATQAAQPGYVPFNEETWFVASGDSLPAVPENTYVFLVWGTLGRGWTSWERWIFDAIEVDELISAIQKTPEGSKCVLWFRSPGGIVTGIPETAAALRKLGAKRQLVAFSDELCASAAEWLACQCGTIYGTPTSDWGSIGVYLAFYDYCAMLEQIGVKLELFRSGQFKGRGLMGLALSDADREQLQAGVMEMFQQFTADVLRNRAIPDEAMQGQTHRGKAALAVNLVDGFFPSAADFFNAIAKGKI